MCLLFTWPCPSKHSRALLHIISLHNLSFPLGNILHFKTYLSLRSKRLHAGVRVKLEAEPDLWFGSQIPFFSLNFVQSRFKIKPLPLQSIAIACYWNPHCSIKDQNLRVCSRINVFFKFISCYVAFNKNDYKAKNPASPNITCTSTITIWEFGPRPPVKMGKNNFPLPQHWQSRRLTYNFLILIIIMCRGTSLQEVRLLPLK